MDPQQNTTKRIPRKYFWIGGIILLLIIIIFGGKGGSSSQQTVTKNTNPSDIRLETVASVPANYITLPKIQTERALGTDESIVGKWSYGNGSSAIGSQNDNGVVLTYTLENNGSGTIFDFKADKTYTMSAYVQSSYGQCNSNGRIYENGTYLISNDQLVLYPAVHKAYVAVCGAKPELDDGSLTPMSFQIKIGNLTESFPSPNQPQKQNTGIVLRGNQCIDQVESCSVGWPELPAHGYQPSVHGYILQKVE